MNRIKLLVAFVSANILVVPMTAAYADEPSAPPAKTTEGSEKLICKTEQVIGSLVRRKKRCFTVEEWRRITDANNDNAQDLVARNRGMMTNGS